MIGRLVCACGIVAMAFGFCAQAQDKDITSAVSKGKAVFEQCTGCHSAETDEKKVGPPLKGLFQRFKLRNGKVVNEKNVRSRIEQGGDGMPAFSSLLSDKQMIDLMSYLKTL